MSIAAKPEHQHFWVCALDHNVCAVCGVTQGLDGSPDEAGPADDLSDDLFERLLAERRVVKIFASGSELDDLALDEMA